MIKMELTGNGNQNSSTGIYERFAPSNPNREYSRMETNERMK